MWPQLLFLCLNTIPLGSSLSYSIHETRDVPLQDVFDRQRMEGDVLLPMRISLRQNQNAILNGESWLMAVSDPDSAQYGQHWNQEEVQKAFEPAEETLGAVTAWLSEHGIDHYTRSENRQWLVFEITVHEAEDLLQTQFFEHRDSKNRFKVSCDEYSLPASLREHIDFVNPGVVMRDITGLTQRSRAYLQNGVYPSLLWPSPLVRRILDASAALLADLSLSEFIVIKRQLYNNVHLICIHLQKRHRILCANEIRHHLPAHISHIRLLRFHGGGRHSLPMTSRIATVLSRLHVFE